MAEITLRSYSQEIDGLIELRRLDEAIAHCRQILQAYPKHLDTYRLLGKAYLEAKRYGDASDIFQRVLSSEPTDFVSHIGMSVIREDDGNLDSAIWHMERAFETNPANQVIQQELKRLFSERDGIEPLKVRLTRGALARMYANGELYPQAVAELRAALQDDPDRPDLQILLAEMYWRSNQQLEAAEISSQILEKLPHCREANRIIAAALQSSGKNDAASVYLRRLAAVDPYTAFVESADADTASIDAASITIEKLESQPGEDIDEFVRNKPDWATSLGAELDSEEEKPEGSPSWLELLSATDDADNSTPNPPESNPFSPDAPDGDATIPDWMREVGWDDAVGEANEERLSFSDDELTKLETNTQAGDDLAPAEFPDWLKGIAPEDVTEEAAPAASETPIGGVALPDWLQGVAEEVRTDIDEVETPPVVDEEPTAAEDITISDAPTEAPPETGDTGREVPTWLEDTVPGASESIVSWLGSRIPDDSTAATDMPDAEVTSRPTDGSPANTDITVSDEASTASMPEEKDTISWLDGVAEAASLEQVEPEDEAPTLPDLDEKDDVPPLEQTSLAVTRELSPDRLREYEDRQNELTAGAVDDTDPPTPQEPAHWAPEFEDSKILQQLPEVSSDGDEADTQASEEVASDWLNRLSDPSMGPSAPPPDLSLDADEAVAQTSEEVAADWLNRLSDPSTGPTAPPPSPDDQPEVPDWLRTLAVDPEKVEAQELTSADEELLQEPSHEAETLSDAEPLMPDAPAEVAHVVDEAPAEILPVTDEAPSEVIPVADEAPAEILPVADEAPSEVIPVADEAPAEILPAADEAPTETAPVAPEVLEIPIEEAPVLTEIPSEPATVVQEAAPKPPRYTPKPKLTEEQTAAMFEQAWIAVSAGDIPAAAEQYMALTKNKHLLTRIIEDLQRALERHPEAPILWQVLGDAHMKADRLADAMEAYRQGLETI